jgi:hypothetical protein
MLDIKFNESTGSQCDNRHGIILNIVGMKKSGSWPKKKKWPKRNTTTEKRKKMLLEDFQRS